MKDFDFENALTTALPKLEIWTFKFRLSEDERKDLISETILKALSNRDKFIIRDEVNAYKFFLGWLNRVMNNIFINNCRRSNKIISFDIQSDLLYEIENIPSITKTDDDLKFNNLCSIIEQSESNEINRKLFLSFYSGYTYRELTELFDIPITTLKTKLHSTRRKIKEFIQKDKMHYEYII